MWFRIAFVFLLCSTGILRAETAIEEGKTFLEKKQPEKALGAFRRAYRENPENLDVLYHFGLAAAATGDHELAMFMFENALAIQPELQRVRAELARSYFHLGLYDLSKREFLQVLRDDSISDTVRQNIARFLNKIEEEKNKNKSLFLQKYVFQLEAARDSNVRSGPSGTVHFQHDIPGLPDTVSVTTKRDGYLSFSGVGSFEWSQPDSRISWQANFSAGTIFHDSENDLDTQFISLRLGPAVRITQKVAAGAMLTGLYMDQDYEEYLHGVGCSFWLATKLLENFHLRGEINLEEREYQETVDEGNNGTFISIRLLPAMKWRNNLFSGTFAYETTDAKDDSEGNDSFLAKLRWRAPLIRKWGIGGELTTSVRKTLYQEPGPFSSSRRKETSYRLGASLDKTWTSRMFKLETWQLGIFYEYQKVNSNIELNEYDKHLTGARMRLIF